MADEYLAVLAHLFGPSVARYDLRLAHSGDAVFGRFPLGFSTPDPAISVWSPSSAAGHDWRPR
jgi:hypothetical protein